jgi:hypothetical protein
MSTGALHKLCLYSGGIGGIVYFAIHFRGQTHR